MFDLFNIVDNFFSSKKFEQGGGFSLNPKSLMVKGDLLKLQEYAHKIGELINDETPVPAWVISKISKVEQTAANVKHTLEAKYPDKLAEGGEIDADGAIVGMMLLHIGKYADKMLALVDSGIEFDEWMQHELAIAGSMIDAVYHYCDYFIGKNKYASGGRMIKSGFHFVNLSAGDKVLYLPTGQDLTLISVGSDEAYGETFNGKQVLIKSIKEIQPVDVKSMQNGGGVEIETYSKPETLIDNTVTLVVKKEKGGKIPSRDSLLNFIQNYLSSGYIGARLDDLGYNRALQYTDIYKVKGQLLENLINKDEKYSISALNTAIKKAAGMALGKPDNEKSEEGFYEDGSEIYFDSETVEPIYEEDCFITDIGSKGYSVSVNGKHIGNYPNFDEALRYAKEWMEANKFWPNMWNINERGTVDLLDGEGKFVQNYAKGGSLKQRKKIAKVMREFKKRILKSHGKVVRNAKQAIAIALSEAKLSKKEMGGLIDSYQLPASDVKPVGQGGIPNYNQPLDIWCLHYEQ